MWWRGRKLLNFDRWRRKLLQVKRLTHAKRRVDHVASGEQLLHDRQKRKRRIAKAKPDGRVVLVEKRNHFARDVRPAAIAGCHHIEVRKREDRSGHISANGLSQLSNGHEHHADFGWRFFAACWPTIQEFAPYIGCLQPFPHVVKDRQHPALVTRHKTTRSAAQIRNKVGKQPDEWSHARRLAHRSLVGSE